jgi:aminoglycoside phosphotransferase (APT) family kinase protein
VAKDLSPRSLFHEAREAKPAFLGDPRREIEVYRRLLVRHRFAPTFWGAEQTPAVGRHWLVVEKVAGVELYQVGEPSTWQAVASWLARMHSTFAANPMIAGRGPRLLRYSGPFYRAWLRRARALLARDASLTPSESRRFERLVLGYPRVVDALVALPVTIIHGDFYPSNILIPHESDAFDVRAIDWEMAAAGPGLVDLAALTSGGWADDERFAMASAYRKALRGPGPTPPIDEFMLQLSLCRLHLAVQWLGWSSEWSPPPEHEHDWLGEALRLAEIVGL